MSLGNISAKLFVASTVLYITYAKLLGNYNMIEAHKKKKKKPDRSAQTSYTTWNSILFFSKA